MTKAQDEDPGVAYELWAMMEDERVKRGWTTLKLAEAIGKDPSAIYRMKTQKRRPPTQTVKDIAAALGFDESEARRAAGYNVVSAPPRAPRPAVAQAILDDKHLTSTEKNTLLAMLEIMMANKPDAGRDGGVAI